MYCKKCKFHSFDHVSACPKCGADWEDVRKALYLNWIASNEANWLNPKKKTAQAEIEISAFMGQEQSPDTPKPAESPQVPVIPAPPQPAATRGEDLEVSLFPELDFSAETPATPKAAPKPKPEVPAPAPPKKDELFLDSLSADDVLELDFSPAEETPAPKKAAPAKPKRDDFFIPELEEMLAPLADDRTGPAAFKPPTPEPARPRTAAKPVSAPSFDHEVDILLDFGTNSAQTKPAEDEFLTLNVDEKDK
jgi:hypothetical protein